MQTKVVRRLKVMDFLKKFNVFMKLIETFHHSLLFGFGLCTVYAIAFKNTDFLNFKQVLQRQASNIC